MGIDRRRDVQRNTAFFLGAFGTALGVLGGGLSFLGILAWLLPEFAQTGPDWFFALVIIGMMVAIVVAWPALDWLLNRHPSAGGPTLALVGTLLIAEGLVAVICTAWGMTGWLAIAGGVLLLPAAQLAVQGGGTEPLTWRSLRTSGVQRMEARAELMVSAVIVVAGLGSLIVLVAYAYFEGDVLPLLGLVAVGLIWLVWHRLKW